MTDALCAVQKSALRGDMTVKRRALSLEDRVHISQMICGRAMEELVLQNAQTIMLYASMPEEINLFPLMEKLLSDGRRIALPRIVERGLMEAWELRAMENLVPGKFGIPTPDPSYSTRIPHTELELVVVPGAAFSPNGGRLGLGGGYYDRFLPQAENAVRFALAFDFQLVPFVPMGRRDARVDYVLTEHRRVSCRDVLRKRCEDC